MSLGPPQGSLGVIMEEGSAEAGTDADEGQSAPHSHGQDSLRRKVDGAAAKGRKRCAGTCLNGGSHPQSMCTLCCLMDLDLGKGSTRM